MTKLLALAPSVLLVCCGSGAKDEPAPVRVSPAPAPQTEPPPKSPETPVAVSAADAKERKLAHRISIDLGHHGFTSAGTLEPGMYLQVSGPPGGPLGLQILDTPGARTDAEVIAFVQKTYGAAPADTSAVGSTVIAGKSWRVIAFVKGESMARSIQWVLDRDGVSVHAVRGWRGALPADAVAKLATTQPFDTILPTLVIE